MSERPTPFDTLRAVMRGYAPRLLQGRGWTLAALALLPVALAATLLAFRPGGARAGDGLVLLHQVMVRYVLPILALVAAPAGIREDLEQRTLALVLVRPAQAWMLPFAKGLLWFLWGALWLALASALLPLAGLSPEAALFGGLALVGAFWAELGLLALLMGVFKRGALWGALYLLVWDQLVRVLPGNLQRLTFLHYIENVAGSRSGSVGTIEILAQAQVATPWPVALLVLLLVGLACWVLAGWQLHRNPVGLSGREAEG